MIDQQTRNPQAFKSCGDLDAVTLRFIDSVGAVPFPPPWRRAGIESWFREDG